MAITSIAKTLSSQSVKKVIVRESTEQVTPRKEQPNPLPYVQYKPTVVNATVPSEEQTSTIDIAQLASLINNNNGNPGVLSITPLGSSTSIPSQNPYDVSNCIDNQNAQVIIGTPVSTAACFTPEPQPGPIISDVRPTEDLHVSAKLIQ